MTFVGSHTMKKQYELKEAALRTLTLVLFVLSGCGMLTTTSGREQLSCEVNVSTVCAKAIDAYLADKGVRYAQAAPASGPQLVPLVAPITMASGNLAAEVDCYVDVDPNGSWLVYAHAAIQPSSLEAVEHLRRQELCASESPERRLAAARSTSQYGINLGHSEPAAR
jgi:hypothetical protein